jgi:hypothetical protein
VEGHRLYALFHLIALRGPRRGEAAGLAWSILDLGAGTLTVLGQLQQPGGRPGAYDHATRRPAWSRPRPSIVALG